MSRYIPEDTIREVQDRADIHEVISGYVQLKRAGKRWKGLCPFHNEKTPSFVVNPDMQAFHCFGCGKGGNVFTFVMEKEKVDFPEAVHILADRYNIIIPENRFDNSQPNQPDKRERLYNINKLLAELYSKVLFSPNGKHGLEYLRNRNFTDDIIKKFQIGFAPDSWDYAIKQAKLYKYTEEELIKSGIVVEKEESKKIYDRFRNRITFPICSERGKVIGFSARTIEANPQGGKYVNSPETDIFKKSRVLYAFHLARKNFHDKGSVILCEGQIDVIAMHRAGFNNTVAPQGTAFTEEQAKLLKRFTNKVYICFDGDSAGTKATVRAIEIMLPLNMEIKVISLEAGSDPDTIFNESGKEKLEEYVNHAKDFFDFLFSYYSHQEDTFTPFGKSKVASQILKFIMMLENSVLRASYIAGLAQRLAIPESTIYSELRKEKEKKIGYRGHSNSQQTESTTPSKNPTIELPPPATAKAEEELLTLSIQYGDVGRRLSDELPPEHISKSVIGNALNLAISLTVNGEWEFIKEELNKQLTEINNPQLSRVLVSPLEYPEDFDFNKAVTECINKIKIYYTGEKIKELMRELRASLPDNKKSLIEEITKLQKEKIELNKMQ